MKYFLLIISVIIIGCSWNDSPEDEWTILIYMAADNSLSDNALEDISEMTECDIPDDVNVIVQIDLNQYSSAPEAKRYKIEQTTPQLLDNLGEIDSGSYQTLADFVTWGTDKFPAKRTALIIWSHGNGWMPGYNKFCPDSEALSYIDIPEGELDQALQIANFEVDLIALDACNMLNLEVISEITEYTKYVLGSERSIPADGFPYDEILPHFWNYIETEVICEQIIHSYVNSHMPYGSQNPFGDDRAMSGSVAKISEFIILQNLLAEFAQYDFSSIDIQELLAAREAIELEFNDLNSDIDLKDYFSRFYSKSSNLVLKELSSTILDNIDQSFTSQYFHNSEHLYYTAGTSTIWWPQDSQTYENLLPIYQKLKFVEITNWDNFLELIFSN